MGLDLAILYYIKILKGMEQMAGSDNRHSIHGVTFTTQLSIRQPRTSVQGLFVIASKGHSAFHKKETERLIDRTKCTADMLY